MTQAFVPLVPGALRVAEPSGPTRLKPSSSAGAQSLFQPATPARLQNDLNGSSSATHPAHGEPKITLERQGDVVTHIRVQCGCGQVIEVKCEY
jgi:hypothetical protein